ncbi:MAG: UbiA family prenyltransferase [Caldilineaceae bacterium]|nr:UbiA family prenyltransferase [Caldilineaceae bacterium]
MLAEKGLLRRFAVYQAERFPLGVYALLMAVLAAGAVGWTQAARAAAKPYPWAALGVAFVALLGFFFQLRVADEYKDFETDRAHRPYRPVPRGLIRLRELAWMAAAAGGIQALLTLWLAPALLWALAAVWGYMALMRWEFGVGGRLHRQPLLYMLSHMPVLPLIFVYATACVWLAAGEHAPGGLGWLLATAYANGVVFEVGRKLRAPADEEPGVETYSSLWGIRRATAVWWVALALAGGCATLAGRAAGSWELLGMVASVGAAAAAIVGVRFVRSPSSRGSARLEQLSAGWLLACYGALALLPVYLLLVVAEVDIVQPVLHHALFQPRGDELVVGVPADQWVGGGAAVAAEEPVYHRHDRADVDQAAKDPDDGPAGHLVGDRGERQQGAALGVERGVIGIEGRAGEGDGDPRYHVGDLHGDHIDDEHPGGQARVEARAGVDDVPPEEQGRAEQQPRCDKVKPASAYHKGHGLWIMPEEKRAQKGKPAEQRPCEGARAARQRVVAPVQGYQGAPRRAAQPPSDDLHRAAQPEQRRGHHGDQHLLQ